MTMFKFEKLIIVLLTAVITVSVIGSLAVRYVDGRISVIEECKIYKHVRVDGVHYDCAITPILKTE